MTDNEYGPFDSEQDAWATEAYAAESAAWDANPVPGEGEKFNLRMLLADIGEIGLELGAYDLSPLRQVAMYETQECVALRGIIRRAYEAGKAAGPDGAVTEWGFRVRTAGGRLSTVAEYGSGEGAEAQATRIAGPGKLDGEDVTWITVSREVTPWTLVPGEEGTNG